MLDEKIKKEMMIWPAASAIVLLALSFLVNDFGNESFIQIYILFILGSGLVFSILGKSVRLGSVSIAANAISLGLVTAMMQIKETPPSVVWIVALFILYFVMTTILTVTKVSITLKLSSGVPIMTTIMVFAIEFVAVFGIVVISGCW